jgi:hypothetical protein
VYSDGMPGEGRVRAWEWEWRKLTILAVANVSSRRGVVTAPASQI